MTELILNEPAPVSDIKRVEDAIGRPLPADYMGFIASSNGGEGFVGEQYLIIWRVEELLDLNRGYEVDKYAPGLLLFGSNGAGEAFAFDLNHGDRVVMVPFIGLSLGDAVAIAPAFVDLIEGRARSL